MDFIYILFFGIIGIIIAIGVGLEISHEIEDFVIYVLFWMLYIITLITFINIILVFNYYYTMKNKSGPPGKDGETGDRGEKGSAGLCDPTCRDSICENQINELILDELKTKNKGVIVKMNNTYIKAKVRQMCSSDEFKQLAPYNGPQNLINYLKDIWRLWIDNLYSSGGLAYFENIAAETEFEWVADNPFNDIKKYDVFYWGMGKQYRPQVVEKCYKSTDGNKENTEALDKIFRTSSTNLYDSLGNDKNSRANNDVSFWRARKFTYKGAVYYPVGDVAYGPVRNGEKTETRYAGIIKFPKKSSGPNRETIIVSGDVKGPINYDLIWSNSKYTSNPFWIWRPIAPVGYISLGDIVTFNATKPLTDENAPIRCVPKSLAISMPPNGSRLWSSYGSKSPINVSLLGYIPNNRYGTFVSASASNAYNLFRAVVGLGTNIPSSDINGSFYYLDNNKYNSELQIGIDFETPSTKIEDIKVGKGYIYDAKKDSKYSVLSYLNLKNNATLVHTISKIQINAQLIPNAISNAYLIKVKNTKGNVIKCLNFDGLKISLGECDELKDSQIFSIIFTGNKSNECKLQHYNTKKIIKYKNNLFTLVSENEPSDLEYQLFIMS